MNNRDFRRFESELGFELPKLYFEWALQLPSLGNERESWQLAFNDADALIEENRRLRQEGWYGLTWHPHLACVGEFEGNHFFIDRDKPGDIFLAHHDDGSPYDPEDYSGCRLISLEEFCESLSMSAAEPPSRPLVKENRARIEQVEKIMEDIARSGLTAACLIFAAVEDFAKEPAARAIARVAGEQAPEVVEEFLEELPGEIATPETWSALVMSWGRNDVEQAIGCAGRHLIGLPLRTAIRDVIAAWRERDESAANKWVEALRDPFLEVMLRDRK